MEALLTKEALAHVKPAHGINDTMIKYILDKINESKTVVNLDSKMIRIIESYVDQIIFTILRPEQICRDELHLLANHLQPLLRYEHFTGAITDFPKTTEVFLKKVINLPYKLEEAVRPIKENSDKCINYLFFTNLDVHAKGYERIAQIFEEVGVEILPDIVRNYGKRRTVHTQTLV